MRTIEWDKLIVVNGNYGEAWGTLGELVANAPANLDSATIVDGEIESWPDFYLEEPGGGDIDDNDEIQIDWTGFETNLNSQRGEEEAALDD